MLITNEEYIDQYYDIIEANKNAKNESLFSLLEMIRKRTGMFTGSIRLDAIQGFLEGYRIGLDSVGVDCGDLVGFDEFVKKRFGFFESTAGWANMITAISLGYDPTDENFSWEKIKLGSLFEQRQEALILFYKVFDEYKETRGLGMG